MSDTPPKAATTPMFNRVNVDRASHVIVDQIKELIREGSLKPGDRLPNERDLCQQFGVSRVTVREALRVLEASGLIQVRVGAQGGSFLTTPSPELVGDNLGHLLTLSDISGSAATEARQVFEVGILPLIIDRATAEDITALRALIAQSEEQQKAGTYSTDTSAAFHARLAACTHNPAVEALMHSFYGPLVASLREAKSVAPTMGDRGIREHNELIDAIVDKDLKRARTILTTHLERTAQRVAMAEAELKP